MKPFNADIHQENLPITFAVTMTGEAVVISVPEAHRQGFEGSFFCDNNVKGLPKKMEPGLYKGLMTFDFWQGYMEGYRADGESDFEFTVTKFEKVA